MATQPLPLLTWVGEDVRWFLNDGTGGVVKEISWTEGAVGMYKIKSEGGGHGGQGQDGE